MGIRQTLNENPAITTGVTIAIIVIAIGIIIWESTGSSSSSSSAANASLKFFSDDDGKTYFADDRTNVPPYKDKRGKMAVGAIVFQCKGKPFVTRLERYTPEGQKKIQDQLKANPNARISIAFTIGYTEYKKPGAGNPWVKIGSPGADIQPHCPDGSDNDLQIVEPTDKDRLP